MQVHLIRQKWCCVLAICITHLAGMSVESPAQTAPITSSGLNTQISGPIQVGGQVQYDITGGTRPNGGLNLFHSFGEFGVPNNSIANFHNNSGLATSNILGRVTGGNISNIFGTIQTSDFGSANLFLMNPAGFLFGPNATVNVGGMVSFTSADYLKLGDGTRFNAIPNTAADILLTASPVAAFGFLGPDSASIAIQGGTLQVADGKTLLFIGGPRVFKTDTGVTVPGGVSMSGGSLSAPNGLIYMATVMSPGEVPIPTLSGSPLGTPRSPDSGSTTIRIRSGEFVMDHASLTMANTSDAARSAIEITVQGAIELKNDSSIISSTDSAKDGADIQIAASELRMNQAQLTNNTTGQGDAGSVKIDAQSSINITDSFISSSSNSIAEDAGSGGQIDLRAPSVEMSGSALSSVSVGFGDAGDILISTNVLKLSASEGTGEPTEVNASTSGSGHGGNISILGVTGLGSRASDLTMSDFSSLLSETNGSSGTAGDITVETVRLRLTEGSEITTASRRSSGNAGNITLNSTESVLLSGSFVKSNVLEESTGNGGNITFTTKNLTVDQRTDGRGGLISTSTVTFGDAGTVTINADRVVLTNGGRLSSSSAHEDPILPPPEGAAGTVLIQGIKGPGSRTSSIVVRGQDGFGASSGISTSTQGTGPGGNITVETNYVQLNSGASITANSNGKADAGNINVTATDGLTMQNSSITTRVNSKADGSTARGGNIKITTSPNATVYLQDNSLISASVPGKGDGGNVTIDPKFVVLQNSHILAQADRGTGGNITIITSVFQKDAGSDVNANAKGGGVHGTVTIQSPNAPAGGKIHPLGKQPLLATSLLSQRCAALTGGKFSSFTVTGRDILPVEPGGWLSSPLAFTISQPHDKTMTNMDLQESLNMPQGERSLLSLRQIAPPGFLTKAFAVDRQRGCNS